MASSWARAIVNVMVTVVVPSPPWWEDRLEGVSHVRLTARETIGKDRHPYPVPASLVKIDKDLDGLSYRRPIIVPGPLVEVERC
jgi:hypothetical protein